MVDNELITKVRVRNVKSILSNVFTSTSGGGTWGSISGTLSSQTDLQTALDAKISKSGTNNITGDLYIYDPTQTYNFRIGQGIGNNPAQILISAKDYAFFGRQALQYLEFNAGNTTLKLGSDATGDTYYRNSSGYLTRLAAGTDGHVLTLASGIPSWAAPAVGALSGLTAAIATNTINNAAYAQEWQWNTLGSGTGLKLSSTSTAAASNTQRLFEIALSGANATSSQATYAAKIANTHTGSGTVTNYGLELAASGGTNNRALYISAGDIYMTGSTSIVNTSTQQFTTQGTSGSINTFNTVATGSSNLIAISQSGTATPTSGVYRVFQTSGINFAPSSGAVDFTGINLAPTINQTGSASGNIYGYRWEPTTTAVLGINYSFYATSGLMSLPASTTTRSTFRIAHGSAPSSPVDGDIWTTTAGLYVRINGATVGPLS